MFDTFIAIFALVLELHRLKKQPTKWKGTFHFFQYLGYVPVMNFGILLFDTFSAIFSKMEQNISLII